MRFRGSLGAGLAMALAAAPPAGLAAAESPAHVFMRTVVKFADADVASVDAGRVVTKQLPAADKPEIAAFGAVRVQADRATALRRFREGAFLLHAPSVLESGRFKNPSTAADLEGLTLEDADVEAARKCRPGDCALKLASSAMERIRGELTGSLAEARPKATALVRRMLVEYVAAYQTGGIGVLATYNDKDKRRKRPRSSGSCSRPRRSSSSTFPSSTATWRSTHGAASREPRTSSTGRRTGSGPSRRSRCTT